MKRFSLSTLLPLTLALTTPVLARPAPLVIDTITWRLVADEGGRAPKLILARGGTSNTSFRIDRVADLQPLRAALAGPTGPIAFTIDREAGILACRGTVASAIGGNGHCRFTSDSGFEVALTQRGLALTRRGPDLLALAFLGVRLGAIDELAREGWRPPVIADAIAATALDLSGAYVRELKRAGLVIRSFDDLIACRALAVDAGYIRELVAAGYPRLSSSDVISMKAVGVNGRFAREINGKPGR